MNKHIFSLAIIGLISPLNPAIAGDWYFSAALGAATSLPERNIESAVTYRGDRYTQTEQSNAELQDHVKVELGYQWKNNLSLHYFHLSDPTRHNDGVDGIFLGFKWGGKL